MYEYDDAGRVVRAVTTSEPRWLDEDQAWAQAYTRWLDGKCPGCGLQLSETTAMKDGEPVNSYTAEDPARCQCCDVRIKKQEEHAKKGSVREGALLFPVRRA